MRPLPIVQQLVLKMLGRFQGAIYSIMVQFSSSPYCLPIPVQPLLQRVVACSDLQAKSFGFKRVSSVIAHPLILEWLLNDILKYSISVYSCQQDPISKPRLRSSPSTNSV